MINFDLPTLDETNFQTGAREQEDANVGRRLRNRKALMEVADGFAAQGKEMSMEDWATASKDILGPAAFLSTTTPSRDAIGVMMKEQSAKAAQTAELRRRDQFNADIKESQDMASFAAEMYLQGDDDISVYTKGVERFGKDRFDKIKDKLGNLKMKAGFDGLRTGMEVGRTMMTDDAERYLQENQFLPKATQDGIRKSAQANQAQAEAAIMQLADQIGASGGYEGNVLEQENLRDTIKARYPNMSAEAVDAVHKKAVQAAEAARQRMVAGTDYKLGAEARKYAQQIDPQLFSSALQADEAERQRRAREAQTFAQSSMSPLQEQQAQLGNIYGDKKAGKPAMFKDASKAAEMANYAGTYRIPAGDFDTLRAAIEDGDKKKVRELVAGLEPMAVFRARVETGAKLATAPFDNATSFYAVGETLGQADEEITTIGKKYASNMDVYSKNAKLATTKPKANQYQSSGSGAIAGISGAVAGFADGVNSFFGNEPVADVAMSSKNAAETLRKGLVDHTVSRIASLREAATINGSFSASAEQIREQEMQIARGVARRFVEGTGLKPGSEGFRLAIEQLATEISQKAGAPQPVNRKATVADRIEQYRSQLSGNLMLERPGMAPNGSVIPSVRSGDSRPF